MISVCLFGCLLGVVAIAWTPTNYKHSGVNRYDVNIISPILMYSNNNRNDRYYETSSLSLSRRKYLYLESERNSTIVDLSKKKPKSKRSAMLWTLNSIENSDTDDVQLSTLRVLREIIFANNTRQVIDAGKQLEALNLTENESVGVRERVIKICSLAGLMPLASSILDGILSECPSYIPNSICYIPLLTAYRKLGKIAKVEECIDKVVQSCLICSDEGTTVQLDSYALNIYIGALCDNKNFEKAFEILKNDEYSMGRFGIMPDVVSFNTVLSSSVRAGYLNIADDVSSLIDKKNFKRDIYTYNAQIRAAILSKKQADALYYIDQVLKSDIRPDQYFVDNAITPLLNAQRLSDVTRLIKGLSLENSKRRSDAFCALLVTLCKSDRYLDDAAYLFDTFVINGDEEGKVTPTTRHFNILLDGYRKNARFSCATLLLKDMIRQKVQPDGYTLTTYMGCLESPRALRKVWRAAVNHYHIPITSIAVTSYITELGRVGDVLTACRVFDVTYRQTNEKCIVMWNALMKALTRIENVSTNIVLESKLDSARVLDPKKTSILPILNGTDTTSAAQLILDYMRSNKMSCPKPNSKTYCMVAAAYARLEDESKTAKAIKLFYDAIEDNISVDGRFLNAVLRCFDGDIDEALTLWRNEIIPALRSRHKKGNISAVSRSNDITAAYSGLMTVCGRAGRPDIAVRLTYAMTKDGIDPNETFLQCYESGKKLREGSFLIEGLRPKRIPLASQFESILSVECTKYIDTDSRRTKDKKIRIIL